MQPLIDHAMDAANDPLAETFLDSRRVFWVRESDDAQAIAAACARASGVAVEPVDAAAGPHAALLGLNHAMTGRFEIRMALYSMGGDALAFVVLPCTDWAELDDDIGDALAQVVWELGDDLDPFEVLQTSDVIDPYLELLADNPGRYGECLAQAVADPASAHGNQYSDGSDDVMPW
ncbi:MAG: hypothetical protein IPL41_05075 [Micropruina sp.]|nr:hypothetical protein [Micropruina sp.]